MLKDFGSLKQVKLLNTSDTLINPATEDKQGEIKTILNEIKGYVDELEIKADTINLNTDELEDKLDEIKVEIQNILGGKVKIWDGINVVLVTATGRLLVSQEPPVAPPGTDGVIKTVYGNVTGFDDEEYLIPSGETLQIQKFSGGGEQDSSFGSAIELWYDPNGNGVGMSIIDVLFCNGTSDQHDLNDNFTGDGTKKLRMRRIRFSGGSKVIFGRWEGYY